MSNEFDVVGIVTWVQARRYKRNRDAEKFKVKDSRAAINKEIVCLCQYFCPIQKGDVIYAQCVQKGDMAVIIKPPFVQVGTDKQSISSFFCKYIRGWSRSRAEELYDSIERIAGVNKVDSYLSELSESWMKQQDSNLLTQFSEFVNEYNIPFLLSQWYRKFDKRRLWLLGLSNKEIRECLKICDSCYKIYEICLKNPLRLYPIPMNKCMEILNRIKRKPEIVDLECGKVVRKLYENLLYRAWTCTPLNFIAKDFSNLQKIGKHLLSEYEVVKEYNCVYLEYPHKVEKYVSNYISQLVLSDNIKDNTPFVHPDEYNPKSPIHSRLEAEFRYSANLSEDQKVAIQGALDHKLSIITGLPGTGKCLHPETPILMADGSIKLVKDIIVGDQVMGPDSKARNVLSVCSGEDEMYKIIPRKGRAFICNEPHVLTLKGIRPLIYIDKNLKYPYCVSFSVKGLRKMKDFKTMEDAEFFLSTLPEDIFDLPLNEYLKRSLLDQEECYLYHTGVEFPENDIPLDPYLVGCWIGNGDVDSATITTEDEEIFDYLSKIIENYGLKFHICNNYPITRCIVGMKDNYFISSMHKLGLFGNKHIPNVYKINSREIRLKLLAGIIDTVGYYNKDSCFEIKQKRKRLADDIEYIAFSLGYMVTKNEVVDGEKEDKTYYRLDIFGEGIEEIPTILGRKRADKQKPFCLRFDVENLGRGDYSGFELDGDGRFLLGDFLVTHNTTSIKEIVYNLDQRGIEYAICAFTGKAVSRLREVLESSVPMTFHLKIKKEKSIRFDHLIIDEASMVTIELFYEFIQRFDFPFSITLVGDPNQLPPIGWGSLFAQCIDSKTIPTYDLVINHRVYDVPGERDGILLNTKRMVRYGSSTDLSLTGMKAPLLPMKFEPTSNFVLMPGNVDQISALVKAFKQQGISPYEITVITPYNKDLDRINKIFQELYREEINESVFDSRGKIWYVKDRVMMTKNDYSINVMNGEEGEILEVESDTVKVKFGEGREYNFPLEPDPKNKKYGYSKEKEGDDEEADERTVKMLTHSYAVSIHKCVAGNTYIFTNKGISTMEKEITQECGWDDKSLALYTRDGIEKTSKSFKGKLENSIVIESVMGYMLEGSHRHPVLVRTEEGEMIWKLLPNIEIGDCLVLKYGQESEGEYISTNTFNSSNIKGEIPMFINEDLCYLIGILIGDGSYQHDIVEFNSIDEDMLKIFKDKLMVLFGMDYSIYLRKFLLWCGLDYVTEEHKKIPENLMKSPNSCQISLLKGIFDANGEVSHKIHVTFSSKTLATQIHLLLLNQGIISSMSQTITKIWKIDIIGDYASIYMSKIGFECPQKQKSGINTFYPRTNVEKNHNKFFFDPVKNITSGKCIMYDFEVPGSHSFVTNGIISHNSQGSEWNYVIIYLPYGKSQPGFINKNLIYTALTRAKRALFFVGNAEELEASTIRKLPFRCEKLTNRLLDQLSVWNADDGAILEGEDDYHNDYEDYNDDDPDFDGY